MIAEIGNGAAGFSAHAARALDDCESEQAPRFLLDATGSVVPFAFAMSVVYRREGLPDHVVDTLVDREAKRALQLYLEAPTSSTLSTMPIWLG